MFITILKKYYDFFNVFSKIDFNIFVLYRYINYKIVFKKKADLKVDFGFSLFYKISLKKIKTY